MCANVNSDDTLSEGEQAALRGFLQNKRSLKLELLRRLKYYDFF